MYLYHIVYLDKSMWFHWQPTVKSTVDSEATRAAIETIDDALQHLQQPDLRASRLKKCDPNMRKKWWNWLVWTILKVLLRLLSRILSHVKLCRALFHVGVMLGTDTTWVGYQTLSNYQFDICKVQHILQMNVSKRLQGKPKIQWIMCFIIKICR